MAHALASPPAPGTQSTQRSLAPSHTGVTPVQAAAAVLVHCSQRPAKVPAVTHTGVAPEQSVAVHARHAWTVRSHTGVAPEQSPSPVHPTQVLVVPSHTGVAPAQPDVMPGAHCTQVPARAPVVAQTPRAPEQSVAVHARQARVVPSQIGVAPEQLPFDRQPTQAFAVASHTRAPVQAPACVASQATQRPERVPVVAQTGAAPVQSAAEQPRQVCVAVLQIGVAPPQSPLPRQPTQVSVVASHTGVAPVHAAAALLAHCTQRPAFVPVDAQTPRALVQSVDLHPRHTSMPGSQIGVAPPQSVLATQPTHWSVAGLQTCAVVHAPRLAAVHGTHAPARAPVVTHTGLAEGHSALEAHARHTCVVVLHTGVAPAQLASVRHGTQVSVVGLHAGVAPVQAAALEAVHCTQRPASVPAVAQTAVAPEQSVALAALHARHVCAVASQMGVPAPQSALVRHAMQTLFGTSQVAGATHAAAFVAVHCTQRPELVPDVAQTGVAPEQSVRAASQARQVRVVPSQIGVAPLQSALPVHWHTLVVVLHVGVPPRQAVWFVVVHCTQEPALAPVVRHAGVAPEHCASDVHAVQRCVVGSQYGRLPPQSALVVHGDVSTQPRMLKRQRPGCAGVTLLVVSRFRMAAVREPGSAR